MGLYQRCSVVTWVPALMSTARGNQVQGPLPSCWQRKRVMNSCASICLRPERTQAYATARAVTWPNWSKTHAMRTSHYSYGLCDRARIVAKLVEVSRHENIAVLL